MNTINGPGISSNTFFSSGSVTPRAQPTAWFVCLHLWFRPKALKPITPHDLCLKKVVDPAHIFLWAAVSTKGNSFASRHRPADFSNYLMYRQLTKKIPFASQPRLRKNGARTVWMGVGAKGRATRPTTSLSFLAADTFRPPFVIAVEIQTFRLDTQP